MGGAESLIGLLSGLCCCLFLAVVVGAIAFFLLKKKDGGSGGGDAGYGSGGAITSSGPTGSVSGPLATGPVASGPIATGPVAPPDPARMEPPPVGAPGPGFGRPDVGLPPPLPADGDVPDPSMPRGKPRALGPGARPSGDLPPPLPATPLNPPQNMNTSRTIVPFDLDEPDEEAATLLFTRPDKDKEPRSAKSVALFAPGTIQRGWRSQMQSASLVDWHREHGGLLAQTDGAQLPELYGNRDDEIDAARAGAGLADLSHLPVLTLAGAEVRRWSNGMFSNNVRKLQPGQGNRSAMCEDRGRVQGLLDLYCLDENTFLGVLEGVSTAWFEERYQMFMVLDDIEMTDRTGETSLFTLLGPTSTGALTRAGLAVPQSPHDHILTDQGGVPVRVTRKQRSGMVGFDLLVPADAGLALWETLIASGASAIGQSALEALRILGGRARWPQDGTDKSLVHELALDKECCAFDKGCYVGQEVINRVDVKGAIQKRLMGLVIDGAASPPLGATVLQGEAEVGTLTSVAWIQNRSLGLGVLRRTAWEPGTKLTIVAPDESRWQAVSADLPFVL